jgi:hypothetical protein
MSRRLEELWFDSWARVGFGLLGSYSAEGIARFRFNQTQPPIKTQALPSVASESTMKLLEQHRSLLRPVQTNPNIGLIQANPNQSEHSNQPERIRTNPNALTSMHFTIAQHQLDLVDLAEVVHHVPAV